MPLASSRVGSPYSDVAPPPPPSRAHPISLDARRGKTESSSLSLSPLSEHHAPVCHHLPEPRACVCVHCTVYVHLPPSSSILLSPSIVCMFSQGKCCHLLLLLLQQQLPSPLLASGVAAFPLSSVATTTHQPYQPSLDPCTSPPG